MPTKQRDHADELADMTPSFNPYGGFHDWLRRLTPGQLAEFATDSAIRLDETGLQLEKADARLREAMDEIRVLRMLLEEPSHAH